MDHLTNMEEFLLTGNIKTLDIICYFYKNDFDKERLKLHHDMMYDLATKVNIKLKDFWDVAEFFKKYPACKNVI